MWDGDRGDKGWALERAREAFIRRLSSKPGFMLISAGFFSHHEGGRPTSARGWYIMHFLHQTPGRRTQSSHHIVCTYTGRVP